MKDNTPSLLIKKKQAITIPVLILGLLGFFSSFFINIGGQLYISEIAFVIVCMFLFAKGRVFLTANLKRILGLGVLWLFVQILTDLVQGTSVDDYLRGWASIGFLLLDIFTLFALVAGRATRIYFFLIGYAIGGLAHLLFQPSPFFVAEPWKFGFAEPVILLVLLAIVRSARSRFELMKFWILPLIFLGGLSLYLNSRTNAWLVFLTAGLIAFRFSRFGRRLLLLRMRTGSIVVVGFFIIALTFGVLKLYQFTVSNGWLGEDAKAKYVLQYNPKFGLIGILVGGRSQILGSMQAIVDSPWMGQGSWARDPKYRLYVYQLEELGYKLTGNIENYIYKTDLIPSHGHFFQAWIWAGPIGAFFWLFVLLVVGRYALRSFRSPNAFFPLIMFLSASAVWDIFFSPFGAGMRISWALTLATIFFAALPDQLNSLENKQIQDDQTKSFSIRS